MVKKEIKNIVKAHLKQLSRLETAISLKRKERFAMMEAAAMSGSDNALKRANEITKQIDVQVQNYMDLKDKIIGQITGLCDPIASNVLYERYVNNKSYLQISIKYGYGERTVYRYAVIGYGMFYEKYLKEA